MAGDEIETGAAGGEQAGDFTQTELDAAALDGGAPIDFGDAGIESN